MGRGVNLCGVTGALSFSLIAVAALALTSAPAQAQRLEGDWKIIEIFQRQSSDFGVIRLHIDYGYAQKKYNEHYATPAAVAHLQNMSEQPRCVAMYFNPESAYEKSLFWYGEGLIYHLKPRGTWKVAAWIYSRSSKVTEMGFGQTSVQSWTPMDKNKCSANPNGRPRL